MTRLGPSHTVPTLHTSAIRNMLSTIFGSSESFISPAPVTIGTK